MPIVIACVAGTRSLVAGRLALALRTATIAVLRIFGLLAGGRIGADAKHGIHFPSCTVR